LFLFDSVAQERNKIAGTEIDLYQMNAKKTVRDPLYDEVVTPVWAGPYRLKAWVEWPETMPEARTEGFRKTFPANMWVARVDVEKVGARPLSYGDIVHFWRTPFFDEHSVTYEHGASKHGYYFNLTEVVEDGHLFDTPSFVGFRSVLARNTEFTPERRLV
jgi:hypothetical protein